MWDSMANLFYSVLPDELRFISRTMRRIGDYVPSLVIGGGIIALGVRMMQGKKEDFSEDSAGENTAAEDSGREVLTGEVVVTDADAGKE